MTNRPTGAQRYRDLNGFLRRWYGFRVQKIPIDAGFSCPNRDGTLSTQGCIYCDERGSGTGAWTRGLGVAEQIREGILSRGAKYKAGGYLAYFQAFTNTYGPLERIKALYDEALAVPGVMGLCIGTRPDCVDEPVLDLLAAHARERMVWLEMGLQSAHDETLGRINRGHDFQAFCRAVEAASARGILICAHLILGLPGEGPPEVRETAKRIAPLPLHGVKLHGLYVVRGTALDRLYQEGAYRPWSQTQYVNSVCDVLERIPSSWVIQRLTGDPPPDALVAPLWTRRKSEILRVIWNRLEQRDTWQGRLLGFGRPESLP